jgi:hypothetical protein
MSTRPSAVETEFPVFLEAVAGWLAAAPALDPPLAAAAEFLAGHGAPTEREVAALANRSDDAYLALAASTLMSLWGAARSGSFELAQVGGV